MSKLLKQKKETINKLKQNKMPIQSKAQLRYLMKNNPKLAKQWLKETINPQSLPERLHKPKKKRPSNQPRRTRLRLKTFKMGR